MKELLTKILEEGEWKSLRFAVYNYLEENEFYQRHLEQLGFENGYDDLVGKTIEIDNSIAKQFKKYVETVLQNGNPIITVCVFENRDYFTIVKPKDVNILSVIKMD